MNIETSNFEFDPSYDPERLKGDEEKSAEKVTETTASTVQIIHADIPDYIFDSSNNPFAYNADSPRSIDLISEAIDTALKSNFAMEDTIIRGIQSGHHELSRKELVDFILSNGSDLHNNADNTTEIHAKEYGSDTVVSIIGGFHVWKPKCEERPQYPVDLWMIFDKSTYENIEYIHPRHGVLARDKWRLKDNYTSGLVGLIVVN